MRDSEVTPLPQRPPAMNPSCIREVWATNLEQEFTAIRRTIETYPYIAMVCSLGGA